MEIANALGSVATALGFLVVIIQFTYTRAKDKKDLIRAEEEKAMDLVGAQEEQVRMKREFDLQLAQSHIQQFEYSLFSLLNLFNQTVLQLKFKEVSYRPNDPAAVEEHGRAVFNITKEFIERICEIEISDDPNDPDNFFKHPVSSVAEARDHMIEYYQRIYYQEFEEILNHYFRSLYHIFKYIDESKLILDEHRPYYATIVRSQLSQNELLAIMFNLMIEGYGYPKFLRLDKKYNILKNFRRDAPSLEHFYSLYTVIKDGIDNEDGDDGINPKEPFQ